MKSELCIRVLASLKFGTFHAQIEQRLTGHTGVIHALRWRRDGQVCLHAFFRPT